MRRGLTFKVFMLLKEYGRMSPSHIAKALNAPYQSVYKALKTLEKKGYVSRDALGNYVLVKKIWED